MEQFGKADLAFCLPMKSKTSYLFPGIRIKNSKSSVFLKKSGQQPISGIWVLEWFIPSIDNLMVR